MVMTTHSTIKISNFEKQFLIDLVWDEIVHLNEMDDSESKDNSTQVLMSLLDKLTGKKA
jgi:hypothetical protein